MENAHTVHAYRKLYKYHKAHPEDKAFAVEYRSELAVYKMAAMAILERYSDLPNSKEILKQLDNLAPKKNALMSRYEDNKAQFEELIQYRRNYEQGIEKKMERWRLFSNNTLQEWNFALVDNIFTKWGKNM